jgi:hypothetical protein
VGAVIHSCDVEPEDLGPMLLGQLTPSRAREVARRVAACPLCAAEAADLASVVAALRAYPPPDVVVQQPAAPDVGPRAAGLETVLAGVHAERTRRWRGRTLGAAAAVAVVLGLGTTAVQLLPAAPDEPAPVPPTVDVRLAGGGGEQGRAVLAARRWGTSIRLEVSGLDPSARYGVWLAAQDGGRLPAGSFRPTAAGSVELRLSAGLPLDAGHVLGVTQLPVVAGGPPVDVLEARLTG